MSNLNKNQMSLLQKKMQDYIKIKNEINMKSSLFYPNMNHTQKKCL